LIKTRYALGLLLAVLLFSGCIQQEAQPTIKNGPVSNFNITFKGNDIDVKELKIEKLSTLWGVDSWSEQAISTYYPDRIDIIVGAWDGKGWPTKIVLDGDEEFDGTLRDLDLEMVSNDPIYFLDSNSTDIELEFDYEGGQYYSLKYY